MKTTTITASALAALVGALATAGPTHAQADRRIDARPEAAVRPAPEARQALRLAGVVVLGPEGIQVVFDEVDDTPRGDPVPGVSTGLDLNLSGRTIASTEADANGRFAFENVRPGTYTVVATIRHESPAVVITENGVSQ